MKKWLTLAVLLFCARLASADMTVVQKVETGPMMGQPAKNTEMTMYIKGHKARIQTKDTASYQILDLQGNKMFVVDPAKKQVMVVNPEMMQAAGKMMGQMNGGKEVKVDVQKTGKSDTVSGYKCDEYSISTSGGVMNVTSVQCLTKDVDSKEFEPFRKYAEGVMRMISGDARTMQLKGLPVRTISKINMMGQSMESKAEVTSVSNTAISDDMFIVPSDYKMMDMPGMPQHKPNQ